MEVILNFAKQDIEHVIGLGKTLAGGFLVLACLLNYIATVQGKANWPALMVSFVMAIFILHNYVGIMDTTVELIAIVNQEVNKKDTYLSSYIKMVDDFRSVYEQNQKEKFSIFDIGYKLLHNLITNLSFMFYGAVIYIMKFVREHLLGIMFRLGPLVIPFMVFNNTKKVPIGWYASFVSVCLWPLVWQLVLTYAVEQASQIDLSFNNIVHFVNLNFVVCILVVLTPVLVSSLVAGVGIGAASYITSLFAIKQASELTQRTAKTFAGGIGGGITGGVATYSQIKKELPGVRPGFFPEDRLRMLRSVATGSLTGALEGAGMKSTSRDIQFQRAIKGLRTQKEELNEPKRKSSVAAGKEQPGVEPLWIAQHLY